jgi:phage baseplate assembly protein W
MPFGFTLPFTASTGSVGYFQMTEDEVSAVKQNLRSLLITNWGERPMRYTFGCNLREFLFDQKTEELRSRINDRILTQVAAWMPFVSVENVQVFFSGEVELVPENGVGLRIIFRLASRPDLSNILDIVVSS